MPVAAIKVLRLLPRLLPTRGRNSDNSAVVLAYLLPALVGLLTAQRWFTRGTVVATGDLGLPIVPGPEYRSLWNHYWTGAGSPSFEIVNAPFAELLRVASNLGISEELSQRLWISSLLAAAAAAVVFLARSCEFGLVASSAAGLLATFNAYRLVAGSDSIPLVALIVAALLGGLIVGAGRDEVDGMRLATFAVVSAGLGYVFTNPPHVALVFMWLAASIGIAALTGGLRAFRRVIRFLFVAAPLVVLSNLWWVVPAVLALTSTAFDQQFTAATINDWAWTHARSSLGNALALNTSWAWSHDEYFPYAPRLERMPLEPLRYMVGALAILGLLLARGHERRPAVALAVVAAVGLFITKGLHEPLANVNSWLYMHAPGFWLFREPAKVLLIVTLAFSLLGGLALSRLRYAKRLPTMVGTGLALFAFVGAMAYTHPLLTGEVTPKHRPGLPGTRVRLPNEWREAQAFLNRQADTGKIFVLPAADFYQMPTTWGYYGVSFTHALLRQPVVDPAPGGYVSEASGVDELERSVRADLRAGRAQDVPPKLGGLGVHWILLRRDLDESFPGREIEPAREIAHALRRVPGLTPVFSNRLVSIYRLRRGSELYPAIPVAFTGSTRLAPEALAAMPAPTALVDARDHDRQIRGVMNGARVVQLGDDVVRKVFITLDDAQNLRVTLVDPLRISVGGRSLPRRLPEQRRIHGPISTPFLLTLGRATFTVDRPPPRSTLLGTAQISPSGRVGVWKLRKRKVVPLEDAGPVGDCNSFDDRALAQLGISSEFVREAGQPTLKLSAAAHTACVAFPVSGRLLPGRHRLQLGYRTYRGATARVCLWQEGPDRCAALPRLERSPGWHRLDASFKPAPGTKSLSLFLEADAAAGRETTVGYRDVALEQYRLVAARQALERLLPVTGLKFPVADSIAVRRPRVSHVDLLSLDRVGDCHRSDDRNLGEVGISAAVRKKAGQPTLRLTAREHAACVTVPILRAEGGRLDVRLDYRSLRGSPARVCLWQEGPDRCAALPSLEEGPGWHRLAASARPSPGTDRMQLFLYADATGGEPTVTEYRAVQLAPASSIAFLGLPATLHSPLPRVRYERVAPWKFEAHVDGAERPFMLVAAETYSSGWRLRRTDRDLPEPLHVEVNEYANGWLLPWEGSYDVVIEYGPERYARAARWISLATIVGLLGWIVWRGIWPAAVRRMPRRAVRRA